MKISRKLFNLKAFPFRKGLVGLLIVFSGCVKNVEIDSITSSQWKVFEYLPEETQFVLYMNLNELRKTEFWDSYFVHSLRQSQKNTGELDVNGWLTEFEKKTGVGLNDGVSEIYVASTWMGNNIITVSFNKNLEKVGNYFRDSNKFDIIQKGEREIFSSRQKISADFYFPNDSLLIIINDADYLNKLLGDNNRSLKENKKLISIIKQIRSKKHYWMATDNGSYAAALLEKLLSVNQDLRIKNIANSIQGISLSADFKEGVNVESIWGCNNSKNAYLLAAAIQSALSMDLFKNENTFLGKLLDKMEIERENSKINFKIEMDKSDIEEIKNMAKKDLNQNKL
jgi:hypothetical protein